MHKVEGSGIRYASQKLHSRAQLLRVHVDVALRGADVAVTRQFGQQAHAHATFALTVDGMDAHSLGKQMGTSVQMIERFYSYLTPRVKKDLFTGPRYTEKANKEDGNLNPSKTPSQNDIGTNNTPSAQGNNAIARSFELFSNGDLAETQLLGTL